MFNKPARSRFIDPARSAPRRRRRRTTITIARFETFDLLKVLFDAGQFTEDWMLFCAGAVEAEIGCLSFSFLSDQTNIGIFPSPFASAPIK